MLFDCCRRQQKKMKCRNALRLGGNCANHGQPVFLSYTSPSRFLGVIYFFCVGRDRNNGFDCLSRSVHRRFHVPTQSFSSVAPSQCKVWRTYTPFFFFKYRLPLLEVCVYAVFSLFDFNHCSFMLFCSCYTFHVPFHSNVRFCLNPQHNNVWGLRC